MAEIIRNVIQFSDTVSEKKLQEIFSTVLIPGGGNEAEFGINALAAMPAEDPMLREKFWEACNGAFSNTVCDTCTRKLAFSSEWVDPKTVMEKLAAAFPEADFVWYGVDETCSRYGYGVAKEGVFSIDVDEGPDAVAICRVCYGGCTWGSCGKEFQFQCGNCPRFGTQEN